MPNKKSHMYFHRKATIPQKDGTVKVHGIGTKGPGMGLGSRMPVTMVTKTPKK